MTSNIDWGLVEDQIAVNEGKGLPLVPRFERRRRLLSLMDSIRELASNQGITKAGLARELGVSRTHLYRWLLGKSLPSTEHYRKLLQLLSKLQALSRGGV